MPTWPSSLNGDCDKKRIMHAVRMYNALFSTRGAGGKGGDLGKNGMHATNERPFWQSLPHIGWGDARYSKLAFGLNSLHDLL